MKVGQIRSVTCSGHIELATFDKFPETLIIVGTGDLSFCRNGTDASSSGDQEMKEEVGKVFSTFASGHSFRSLSLIYRFSFIFSR